MGAKCMMFRTDSEKIGYVFTKAGEATRIAWPGATAIALVVSFEHEPPAVGRMIFHEEKDFQWGSGSRSSNTGNHWQLRRGRLGASEDVRNPRNHTSV